MLSGRELAIERNDAGGELGQPAGHLHPRHRPRDGAGQRGHPRGPAGAVGARPAAGVEQTARRRSPSRGSTSARATPTTSSSGARQPEFDYPGRPARAPRRRRPRGPATTGDPARLDPDPAAVLAPVPRPRPADLRPDHVRQPAAVPPDARGPAARAIAPFLRYDKDPYLVVDDAAGSSTSRTRTRSATRSRTRPGSTRSSSAPSRASYGDDVNYIRNSVKITMDAYDGTMQFYVADPTDPIIRAWQGDLPRACSSRCRPAADGSSRTTSASPRSCSTSRRGCSASTTSTHPLTFFNNTDRWTVPDAADEPADASPSEAYYVVMRMPGEPKAEFLLLQPMIADATGRT